MEFFYDDDLILRASGGALPGVWLVAFGIGWLLGRKDKSRVASLGQQRAAAAGGCCSSNPIVLVLKAIGTAFSFFAFHIGTFYCIIATYVLARELGGFGGQDYADYADHDYADRRPSYRRGGGDYTTASSSSLRDPADYGSDYEGQLFGEDMSTIIFLIISAVFTYMFSTCACTLAIAYYTPEGMCVTSAHCCTRCQCAKTGARWCVPMGLSLWTFLSFYIFYPWYRDVRLFVGLMRATSCCGCGSGSKNRQQQQRWQDEEDGGRPAGSVGVQEAAAERIRIQAAARANVGMLAGSGPLLIASIVRYATWFMPAVAYIGTLVITGLNLCTWFYAQGHALGRGGRMFLLCAEDKQPVRSSSRRKKEVLTAMLFFVLLSWCSAVLMAVVMLTSLMAAIVWSGVLAVIWVTIFFVSCYCAGGSDGGAAAVDEKGGEGAGSDGGWMKTQAPVPMVASA